MIDPRLAEIDFLMYLERETKALVSFSGSTSAQLIEAETGIRRPDGTAERFKLDAIRFRAMVLDLVMADMLVGGTRQSFGSYAENDFAVERINMTRILMQGGGVVLMLSHKGRVHLWNQRDALLKDPDREPFGLRSRAAWDRELFVRLRWATPETPLGLIFLDLDNFGRVNKDHGAPVGDKVLRLVFGLVNSLVGTRGAAYRYGGEEVGVLLPGFKLKEAVCLAEELRALIERDVHVNVPELPSPQTASFGVAVFSHALENDDAVMRTDKLMRRAKEGGRNRVVAETV